MRSAGPFDARRVRLRRRRALAGAATIAPLAQRLAAEVAGRAAAPDAPGGPPARFERALDLGCGAGWLAPLLPAERVVALDPEPACARAAATGRVAGLAAPLDRPPFAPASFDLVASLGAIDTVNDLPGALRAVRLLLRPGGLFQAALAGGENLLALRRALVEAEDALFGAVAPRLHPMLDPAQAPALLQQAGFTDPVVDVERWTLRYQALTDLVRDLRAAGLAGALAVRPPWRGRAFWADVARRFATQADAGGRVPVTVTIVHLRGRAPRAPVPHGPGI
jgi:NADH dehydrogenase [ubiquinone] 1 alpha subcomplex assembly factor 5